MSRYIELQKCDLQKLIDLLMRNEEIADVNELVSILEQFGDICGEKYYLLNNEYFEEYNSYWNLFGFVERYYGIEDAFDETNELFEDAVCNSGMYEVADQLGIELPESV